MPNNEPIINYTQISETTAIRPHKVRGIFWGAILGGALAALAVTMILTPLGISLGFASVSPWSSAEGSAVAFTAVAAIWLIVVQWLASGLGGYITGRLRTRWVAMHEHEGFFRDTAHGFLTWALAAVLVALFAVTIMPHHPMGQGHDHGMDYANRGAGPVDYEVDRLYRGRTAAIGDDLRSETGRILTRAVVSTNHDNYFSDGYGNTDEAMPSTDDDRRYLTQLVASHTGLTADEARERVDSVITDSKNKLNAARKAAAALAFYTFFSMLMGAFIASVAAALGGRHRDLHDEL